MEDWFSLSTSRHSAELFFCVCASLAKNTLVTLQLYSLTSLRTYKLEDTILLPNIPRDTQ